MQVPVKIFWNHLFASLPKGRFGSDGEQAEKRIVNKIKHMQENKLFMGWDTSKRF